MPTISLPTPGVTPGTAWASELNVAINAVNNEVDAHSSELAIQVKEAPLTPYRFGAVPPVAGSLNTQPIKDMFVAAQQGASTYGGADVYIPPGFWRVDQASPITLGSNVKVSGAGRRTRLAAVGGSTHLFSWSSNISDIQFSDMWIETATNSADIFRITGGIYNATFNRLYLRTAATSARIWNQQGSLSFIQIHFLDCEMERTGDGTTVPFYVLNSGGAANFNLFSNLRLNGYNNTQTPFMRIESTLAQSYTEEWTFNNVLGEQNPGGLIHTYGALSYLMDNIVDMDATTDYVAPLIAFYRSNNDTGLAPRGNFVRGGGRRGRSMVSGVSDLHISTSGRLNVVSGFNPTPASQLSVITSPYDTSFTGVAGKPLQLTGTGTPLGNYPAVVGSTYLRTDGGPGTTFYFKESGTDTSGWVAK